MIIYFSATGNTKHIASSLAKGLEEPLYNLEKMNKLSLDLDGQDYLIVVSPVYFWGLPFNVYAFFRDIEIKNFTGKMIFVASYGSTPGNAAKIFTNAVNTKNKIPLTAAYSIKMPDTFTPIFDLSNKDKVQATLDNAEKEIASVINKIKNHKFSKHMKKQISIISFKIHASYYMIANKTNEFHLDRSACTGCGLCVRDCPVNAMKMVGKRPIWEKESCLTCLRCLHHCPEFAITRGKVGQEHGQYTYELFTKNK